MAYQVLKENSLPATQTANRCHETGDFWEWQKLFNSIWSFN